ncbi:MAG: YdbH domain-containing protein, partial [Desulfonatronovibrio sp.]
LQGKNYLIPFSLQADLEDEHSLNFSAWSLLLGHPFSIEGHTNVNTLETSVQARTVWSEFLEPGRAFYRQGTSFRDNSDPVEAGLSLHWETDSQGGGQARVDMRCQVSDLRMQGPGLDIGLEKGSFSAKAGFDDNFYFDRLEADLSLSGLSLNENRVDRLTLAVREQASVLELFAGLEHPFSAFLEVRGRQSSINEFLKNSPGYKADFEWKAGLDLGPEQFDLLSPVEIETGSSVTVNAHGQLKGEYLPDAAQPENSWFLQVSAEQSRTGPVSFHLPELALQVSDLELNLPFLIEARPGRTGAKIMPGSRISLKETVLKQQSARYQVEGLEFIGQGKKPFAEFEVLENGIKSLSVHTRLNSGFEVISQNADVSGRDLLFSAKLQEDEQGVLNADISMQPDIALVRLKQTGVEIEDVSLDVPFVLGNARPGQGKFSTGRISYDGMHFPGISGQIIVENYQVKSRGSWPFLPGADLELAVDMLVDPGKDITGKIKAHTNWFDIPEKELRDVIVSMPEDMSITGSARAELALAVDAGSLRPQALIEIRDAGMLNPDMDMEIAGISGSMFIDDFFPLTTPGRQRMEIQKLRIGQLELIDGFATFRLESPERIFVEKTRWNLPEGGFIAAHAARIDLQDSNADFEVFFEDIDLVRLVSRISQEKIAGSGRVYGRVPLLYKQDKVTIGQGYLYSVPGTGRLRIRDEEWLDILLLYVRQAMKDHPYLSTVSERLEQALRDFEYDFLSVNLEPGPDDTSARIELRGKGVRGDPPQEVGSLVINVNDLQEIVNRVLHFQLTRDESVKKALDDLLDFEK